MGRASDGRVPAYSLAVVQRIHEPVRSLGLGQFRSYLRDERGVVHATGAPRGATIHDPALLVDEQAEASARAAKWMKDRQEDLARQAKYQAEHFPEKVR